MAKTRIAAALVVVFLTSCSVGETEQPPRALYSPFAQQVESGKEAVDGKGIDGDPRTSVTRAEADAIRNAGLRSDFKGPC